MTESKELKPVKGQGSNFLDFPIFQDAFRNMMALEEFCKKVILDARIAPQTEAYYPHKVPGTNERDFTKGNVGAVMAVVIQGAQLGLPPLTALQQIVWVNGMLSIKGDAAKSLILASGKIEPGSWVETEEGRIEDGTYKVTITAQRSDTKEKLSRSFSVLQAKKAGLWVTDEMLRGPDGWKWKKSAWYRYPERMCKYRALGFLARDLFPDVMLGCYITEEAKDMTVEAEVVETKSGDTIVIPDKKYNQERSKELTKKAVKKIEDNNKIVINEIESVEPQNVEIEIPQKEEKSMKSMKGWDSPQTTSPEFAEISKEEKAYPPEDEKQTKNEQGYTEDELKMMPVEKLMEIADALHLTDYINSIPGKNTNKKLRSIILDYQEGKIQQKAISKKDEVNDLPFDTEDEQEQEELVPPIAAPEPEDESDPVQDAQVNKVKINAGIEANKDFSLNFTVPPYEEGTNDRSFPNAAKLYGILNSQIPPITSARYLELKARLGLNYPDKDTFCFKATEEEIRNLVRENLK